MRADRTTVNALMDRASSGDRDAFGALASAVQDELFRLALAIGLTRDDAAEVTQEALLRAFAGRRGWRRNADVMAWLCGIVVNVAREWRRRQRRRVALPLDADSLGTPDRSPQAAPARPWEPEQLRELMEAVRRLPPRQREAIACRYLRRMSIRQTAQVMGCAEGTVKSAVSAALERLRGILRNVP